MNLFPYQHRGVDHIINHERCGLFWEMGLGKTITVLVALSSLPKPALIIAPKRVADHVWAQEVEKWGFPYRVVQIAGTPQQRERAIQSDADLFVINYELVQWLVDKCYMNWRWQTVVADESDRLKNHSSKTFKALRKVAGQWKRFIAMTGTPCSNNIIDLWSQVFLMDRGQRLGRTITACRQRWFRQDYMGWNWTPNMGAVEEMQERIKDICLSMRTADYLDLPERVITDVPAIMPPAAWRVYKDMKKDMIAQVDEAELNATTAATMVNKLRQIASGFAYGDDGTVQQVHTGKLEVLDDIITDSGDEPVLVVYQYKSELAAMRARYPDLVELRDTVDIVEKWNKRQLPIMAIHPASAGHGLNLQAGGRIMVWTTPTWSLGQYEQTNARLYRMGQDKPVMIYRITVPGTVDEQIHDVLARKGSVQDALMDALKSQ
jgi:SNF2 family DNA or RNA helicase